MRNRHPFKQLKFLISTIVPHAQFLGLGRNIQNEDGARGDLTACKFSAP